MQVQEISQLQPAHGLCIKLYGSSTCCYTEGAWNERTRQQFVILFTLILTSTVFFFSTQQDIAFSVSFFLQQNITQ